MEYDFKGDWRYYKAKDEIPREISTFLEDVFLIMEIRKRVDRIKEIVFEIRTKENNHRLPHVHARYDKYEISISIHNGEVLAGNLPSKQKRIAIRWVEANRERLLGEWLNTAISATSVMTQSRLDYE